MTVDAERPTMVMSSAMLSDVAQLRFVMLAFSLLSFVLCISADVQWETKRSRVSSQVKCDALNVNSVCVK